MYVLFPCLPLHYDDTDNNSATRNGSISTASDCLKSPVGQPNGSVLIVGLGTTKGPMGL